MGKSESKGSGSSSQTRPYYEQPEKLADYLWRIGPKSGIFEQHRNLQFSFELVVKVSLSRVTPIIQGLMPKARINHAAVNVFDKSIVIFGGKTEKKGKNN